MRAGLCHGWEQWCPEILLLPWGCPAKKYCLYSLAINAKCLLNWQTISFCWAFNLESWHQIQGKFYDSLGENSESLFIYICSTLVIFRHMTVSNLFYPQSLASQLRNYRGRGTPVLRGSDHRLVALLPYLKNTQILPAHPSSHLMQLLRNVSAN